LVSVAANLLDQMKLVQNLLRTVYFPHEFPVISSQILESVYKQCNLIKTDSFAQYL